MSWYEMLEPSDRVDRYLRLSVAIMLFIFNVLMATNIETPFPALLVEAYSIPLTRIALLTLVLLSAYWCPSVGIMAALAYVSLGSDMNVAAAVPVIQQMAVVNPLDVLMTSINTNPYFIGIMMLLLNLGGRFLSLEISKEQEKFLSQPIVRRFFLFAVLFVATRNILIAAALAFLVILMLGYLFNENSSLCLWKSCVSEPMTNPPEQSFIGLTPEEALILKRLQDKQMAAQNAEEQKKEGGEKQKEETKQPPTAASVYQQAITNLKKLF